MNEQTPFGFFPGNPGGNFPGQSNCQCSRELQNINNKISNIEQQINRLDRRIRRLELNNRPTPYGIDSIGADFNSSYEPDNYII